ncbi:uncharacterized protein PpBr36_10622 [Pyricularia pennisetigena]|uniref:uncharacterized protein n=1 Tax=Pyricularia pennisetigena TaxID=1578925 RepID=UPI001150F16F|nr:uncharacterized protein PpBr36_10622 [Pyricularia pennisetigena]TLS21083.1 hypothetical protein PpBr36_10622 [Pyricularia pennisetigena]
MLAGLFVEQASESPERLALDAWDHKFTYAELDRATTRLARHLVGLMEPGTLIPICFEKSAWAIIAMLSVLKAGGGFVPLDPTQPKLRRDKMIRQLGSRPPVIIASDLHAKTMEGDGLDVVSVGPSQLEQLQDGDLPPRPVRADSAAYCLFTSGSTGEPKGVVMSHGAVVSSQVRRRGFKGYDKDSRVFQFSSYSFDTCIDEIFMTLGVGGCVCIPSDDERINSLAATIHKMSVNLLEITTTVAALINPDDVPSVKTIIFGGEFVPHTAVAPWQAKARVINSYGPTECCVDCVFGDVTAASTHGLIGTSAASATWIVDPDDHNKLLPIGATGELLIEGPVLATGYLNDKEQTDRAFIRDPEWLLGRESPGAPGRSGRLYKTGDLARYTTDGSIVYVGRKDTQVKINGQRVELGEVESHVSKHVPRASHVVAEAVSYPDGTQALVAFVVGIADDKGSSPETPLLEPMANVTRLQNQLSEGLPRYMIPTAFLSCKTLPLTVSGKADRRLLRETAAGMARGADAADAAAAAAAAAAAPRPISSRERKLQQIWADVLSMEKSRISADSNFFELGGDSVAAIKIAGLAAKQGMKLAVADVFKHPNLCQLAARAAEKKATGSAKEVPVAAFSLLGSSEEAERARDRVAESYNLDRDSIVDLFPCTPLQEGLLSLTAADPSNGQYMMQQVLRLSEGVDMDRFRAAWEAVFQHLAILQTRIFPAETGQGLLQGVVKTPAIPWREEASSLAEYLQRDRSSLMGLGDPLTRYAVVDDGRQKWFVWTIHHCLYDGWTLPRTMALAERAYAHPELGLGQQAQFSAFIKYLLGRDRHESGEFWKSYLAGVQVKKLPQRAWKPDTAETRGYVEKRRPISFASNKKHLPSTFVRAAMGLVLADFTGSDDVVYGSLVSGRQNPVSGIEDMMGPTFAMVPVRICLRDRSRTKEDLLDAVQDDTIRMIPHEQEGLHNISSLDSSCRDACDFQVALSIQQHDRDESFGAGTLGQWQEDESGRPTGGAMTYPVHIECLLDDGEVSVRANSDRETMSPADLARMVDHFFYMLEQLLRQRQEKLAEMQALVPSDLRPIVESSETVPKSSEEPPQNMVLEKAVEIPDAVAIEATSAQALTTNEKKMQMIWSKILCLDPSSIDRTDSFFRLGGNSIAALKVIAEAKKQGMILTVAQMLRNPRLNLLAAMATERSPRRAAEETSLSIAAFSLLPSQADHAGLCSEITATYQLPSDAIQDLLPCTPLQEGLISLTSSDAGNYLVQKVLCLSDHVDLDALRSAWERVVSALPILRTRLFFTKEHGILQGVMKQGIDWNSVSPGGSLDEYLRIDVTRRTGLGDALSRFAIVTEGRSRYLVWSIHHSVFDGWMLPRVVEMAGCEYKGVSLGSPVVDYGHFIRYLVGLDVGKTREFWRGYLNGARRPLLLASRGNDQDEAGSAGYGILEMERAVDLKNNRRQHHTASTLIRAAMGFALAHLGGGCNDVVFASTVHGRSCPVPGIENVMGPTIATIPVRVQFQDGQAVGRLLDTLHSQATLMTPHEHYGIQNIRRIDESCRNACDIMAFLVIQQGMSVDDEAEQGSLGQWQYGPARADTSAYPIDMECTIHDQRIAVRVTYSREAVAERDTKSFVNYFYSVLEQLSHSTPDDDTMVQDIAAAAPTRIKQMWAWEDDDNTPIPQSPLPSDDGSADMSSNDCRDIQSPGAGSSNQSVASADDVVSSSSSSSSSAPDDIDNSLVKSTEGNHHHQPVESVQSLPTLDTLSSAVEALETLRSIWASVLDLPPLEIGIQDNFIKLGGDSVMAMKVAAAARAAGWTIPVSKVMRFPTISQQLPYFVAPTGSEPTLAVPRPYSLVPSEVVSEVLQRLKQQQQQQHGVSGVLDVLPTTDFQNNSVREAMDSPKEALNYMALGLGQTVDFAQVHDAVNALVERLETLRTVFMYCRGRAWQVVLKTLPVALGLVTAPDDDLAVVVDKIMSTTHGRCYYDHPIASFTLAKTPRAGYRLVIGMSHAQYDGLSISLILRTLESVYSNNTACPLSLPPSTYALLQHNMRSSASAYWTDLLRLSRPFTQLKTPAREPQQADGQQVRKRISASTSVELPPIAQSTGTSIAALANAAWALLLHTLAGDEDVVYVTLTSGRGAGVHGIESVAGCTINLVPVRVGFRRPWAVAEVMACVQAQFAALGRCDTMGLDDIVAHCTGWPADAAPHSSVFFHQAVDERPEHALAGAPAALQMLLNPAVQVRRTLVTTHHADGRLGVDVLTSSQLMSEADAADLAHAYAGTVSLLCRAFRLATTPGVTV